ncbi:MAG: serine/threonine protein kinase [Proteobacteria bacterium]|nr:serine/threonine protein kinase [Pseudomonadota bacterium]
MTDYRPEVSSPDSNSQAVSEKEAEVFNHPALAGKYTIQRRLAAGSQGQMFLGLTPDGKRVAIKAYDIARMANWKATSLFEREMETMLTLDVDGVPKCYETIDASTAIRPYYFIVQAYVDGQSLQDMLDAGHRFEIKHIRDIVAALVRILMILSQHSPPVIHRDIKPSNVMMTPDGKVYLVDFGTSVRNTFHVGGSTFAGTAGYMSPEQALGEASPASDVYGLAATLIHLLSGKAPYEMPQRALRLDFRPYMPEAVPKWAIALIGACTHPMPERRPTLDAIAKAAQSASFVDPYAEAEDAGKSADSAGDSTIDAIVRAQKPKPPARTYSKRCLYTEIALGVFISLHLMLVAICFHPAVVAVMAVVVVSLWIYCARRLKRINYPPADF